MPYFVFVEFGNEFVSDFLEKFRNALGSSLQSSPIHVTLRGPYSEPPEMDELEFYAERLRGYGVKIHSHGSFVTPSGFSVFLRAECSVFREMWHKPDYQVPLARIQPHITVYETVHKGHAEAVRNFLKQEQIHIHTYDLHVSVYQSKSRQRDMFDVPSISPLGRRVAQDVFRISDDVLDRAKSLGVRLANSDLS